MSVTLTLSFAAMIFVLIAYLRSHILWRTRTKGRPLPPGPYPLPIVGNLFDVPNSKPWFGFRDMCAKYGESLIHFGCIYFLLMNALHR